VLLEDSIRVEHQVARVVIRIDHDGGSCPPELVSTVQLRATGRRWHLEDWALYGAMIRSLETQSTLLALRSGARLLGV